jgi:hypothetical protein
LPLVEDQDSASGSQLLDIQIRNALAEEAKLQLDGDDMEGDAMSHENEEQENSPEQDVSGLIYRSCKRSGSSNPRRRSAIASKNKKDEDQASVLSMTNHGALDWDHTGDESEVDRVLVSSKPKRRASIGHQSRRDSLSKAKNASPSRRRARAESCPADSFRYQQPRDSKGRFARRASVTSVACGAARPRRKSSEKPQLQRDANGRFARTEFKASNALGSSRKEESSPDERPSKSQQHGDPRGRITRSSSKPVSASLSVVKIASPETQTAPHRAAKAKRPPAASPYFSGPISPPKTPKKDPKPKTKSSSPSKRSPGGVVSCIPFPALSAPHFGLIQEKLAHDPFRLLIAVTFLIRTHGKHAIPVFYSLISRYPTPQSLVEADKEDIIDIIRHLGLQNSRASTYQTYAAIWLENPPVKGKRYPVKGYPRWESGRDVGRDEVIDDEDLREAWEIGHMTSGPYALDSWRIFCRDVLRGVAKGWNGEGAPEGLQPEWMRVQPEDKELRAYLRWMWLKEGFEWDPFTGEKEVAGEELMRAAMEGRIAWDERGGMRILHEMVKEGADLVQGGLGGAGTQD